MALSNWDTLAFDKNGNPTNGIFQSGNMVVEIYKNWLYVHDAKAWEENCCFVHDTIMEVQHCSIIYKPFHIIAKRGRQSSILCVIWTCNYDKEGDDKYDFMIGCGVYGYRGDDWVGVETKTFIDLKNFARKVIAEELNGHDIVTFPDKPLRFNQGDAFFANVCDTEIPATEINSISKPLLDKILEG